MTRGRYGNDGPVSTALKGYVWQLVNEGLVRRKQSFLTHSHQEAYRRRKHSAKQLARIDPILIIDAQNTSFVRESQDDSFRFTPAEAKVSLQFRNEFPVLNGDHSDSRFIQRPLNDEGIVAGYNIYRSTSPTGTYARINSTPDANTAYTDSGVVAGQTYYYEATAVNSAGQESVRSTPPVAASIP